MSYYDNGYKPTCNLRFFRESIHQSDGKLQQQWVSDFVGFTPIWRDVDVYTPAYKQ